MCFFWCDQDSDDNINTETTWQPSQPEYNQGMHQEVIDGGMSETVVSQPSFGQPQIGYEEGMATEVISQPSTGMVSQPSFGQPQNGTDMSTDITIQPSGGGQMGGNQQLNTTYYTQN